MKIRRPWCALALCALPPAASAQTGVFLGPETVSGFSGATGRVSAIAASPTDPARYFIAGADGGVWRTTNAGASWTPLTDQMPTTAIGALAIDPNNESIIYAGSGEANFANHSRYGLGVYKSIDAGETWTRVGEADFAGRCISRIIVSPADSGVVYAAVTHAGGFPALAAAKRHPGANGPVGVYRSTDGGLTWGLLSGGLPAVDATDLAMDPSTPSTLYAGIGAIFGSPDNGLYKSTDGGDTWMRLAIPQANPGRIGVAVAPSMPSRVLVCAFRPASPAGTGATALGVARSDTGGSSWVSNTTVGAADYGWYFGRLAIHPTNPSIVYFGELDVHRSVNAGATFTALGVPHPDVHAFAFDASGRLLVGDDGGVHRSASGAGGDWQVLNNGLGITQLYPGLSTHPTNPEFVLAGLQDNGVARRPSGPNWTSVLGGDGGWTQIDQLNPGFMFAESQGTGSLARSINGGTSFSYLSTGITGRNCFLPPFLIDPNTPGRLLYATERVWVSTNNGTNWATLSPDLTSGGAAAIRALAIAPSDSRYVYAATNDGRVLASADSGATFALRLSDNPGWPRVTRELTVDPTEPRVVFLAGAAFGGPHVRVSGDAGAHWETLDADLPDTPINVIAYDPRGLHGTIYAGGDGGVWRSTDAGSTWQVHGENIPHTAVVDLVLDRSRDRLILGTFGRGSWGVPLACVADFNGSGGTPDDADISAFFFEWSSGSASADANASGGTPDDADVSYFIQRWTEGC